MEEPITKFTGEYGFLSNFYPRPMTYCGFYCRSAEHAFQLAKTTDPGEQEEIANAASAAEAKRLGRRVHLRPGWEIMKTTVMREVVGLKFFGDPSFSQRLLDTGRAKLIEGNSWGDTFWGIDEKTGVGENMLGRILMETREILADLARIPHPPVFLFPQLEDPHLKNK